MKEIEVKSLENLTKTRTSNHKSHKRGLFVIAAALLAASTMQSCGFARDDDEVLTEMKTPVVIIGVDVDNYRFSAKDSTGRVKSFGGSFLSSTVSYSRKVGDTLK